MVQKRVQTPVRAKNSGGTAMDDTMPQYMSKSPQGTGYLFRRGVPADIRSVIGKREFKFTLGGDFRSASQRCRELAVQTDREIASARAGLTAPPPIIGAIGREASESPPSLAVIREITSDLIARLQTVVREQVLRADQERRYHAWEAQNPAEVLKEIERFRDWIRLAQFGDHTAAYGWNDMLTATLKRDGYRLANELLGSALERELLVEYASAYGDALDVLEAQYTGKAPFTRQPAAPILRTGAAIEQTAGAMLLSAAIKEFLTHLPPAKRAMNEKHTFILPAFLEVVGDLSLPDLRQAHVRDFLLTVQKLPPRWSDIRKKRGQSIRELSNQEWDETIGIQDLPLLFVIKFTDKPVVQNQIKNRFQGLQLQKPLLNIRVTILHTIEAKTQMLRQNLIAVLEYLFPQLLNFTCNLCLVT